MLADVDETSETLFATTFQTKATYLSPMKWLSKMPRLDFKMMNYES